MILDMGPIQDWINAQDAYGRAKTRHDAAQATGNRALIDYTRSDLENTGRAVNAALKVLNALEA